jgi:tagatose 1,6-diphosphate aldolase
VTRAADLGRRRRLHRISAGGVFALVACDHRDSLRIAFEARGVAAPEGPEIAALKTEIVTALAPAATGVLIDAEHGAAVLAGGAGGAPAVVMPLEAQGYADAESGRVTTFLPGWGPDAALAAGADACKLLLPFRADHDVSAEPQLEVVARAVQGCHAAGLPLVLEPIVYRLPGEDESDHAAAFPGLVVAGVERLVPLGADIMKVQFPRAVDADADAEHEWCRRLDAACGWTPWVLLGGGATHETFAAQVNAACRAGASGYIVGRTAWEGAVTPDAAERRHWLVNVGEPRLRAVRERAVSLARPFTSRVPAVPDYPPDWYIGS